MRALRVTVVTLGLLAALPAAAQDRSHRHQFGFDVTVGSGYLVRFKYGGSDTCGQDGRNTCYYRLPTWIDLKAFFGITHTVDLVIEQRIGLEEDLGYTGSRDLILMPGVRIYPSGTGPFKFYLQLQFLFDFTDPGNHGLSRYDVGFHEANGFQWDFIRWMGAYFQISETFGVLRNFDFQLEAGAGLEGRFP